MSLLVARILTLVLLLLGTFICGTVPIILVKRLKKRKTTDAVPREDQATENCFTSFLLCFGGGVLFATCFVHLIPEVRASFERYWLQQKDDISDYRFPIPELIVCFGFISVYIIEEVLHAVLRSVGQKTQSISSHSPALLNSGNTREGLATDVTYGSTTTKHPPAAGLHNASLKFSKFSLRGMIVICALSFHSIFEGFAVGLQENEKETWTLFFAVSVHKFVIAFVVGLELYSQGIYATAVIIYMSVFAVMSPLGIFIAMVTERSLEGSADLAVGTLNGLATGTLVYVTFFEVLQREKYSKLSGLLQLLAMLVGFGLMITVQWLTGQ